MTSQPIVVPPTSPSSAAALRGLLAAVVLLAACSSDDGAAPAPTAAPSASPTAASTATAPPSSTATAAATSTATAAATSTAVPSSTPTAAETPTAADTSTATATAVDVEPTATATAVDTPTATATAVETPTATATAVDTETPTPTPTADAGASGLTAELAAGEIRLAWMAADPSSGYSRSRLLRRLNASPSGPEDAEAVVLYDGDGDVFADPLTGLLPDVPNLGNRSPIPRRYFYRVFACTPEGACEANGSETNAAAGVPDVLRAGGYVIHWRHAAADVCGDRLELGKAGAESVPDWWRSCDANCDTAYARQLNAAGRVEALALGNEMRAQEIAIGRVISSEFCRNFTTAELMAFEPPIELRPEVTYFVYDEPNRCELSYGLIGEVPAAGTNTAIIGHAGFNPACPILSDLAWSEAAIFKPDGTGASELAARVPYGFWEALR